MRFTESVVEEAALAWLESLGYTVLHGPEIAPGEAASERETYGQAVFEARFQQALARLNPNLPLEFRRICDGKNWGPTKLAFEPRFVSKAANVPGLQIADLVARPIGRHVLDPSQPNRAWDTLHDKLDRSPQGQINGWGLKVFP